MNPSSTSTRRAVIVLLVFGFVALVVDALGSVGSAVVITTSAPASLAAAPPPDPPPTTGPTPDASAPTSLPAEPPPTTQRDADGARSEGDGESTTGSTTGSATAGGSEGSPTGEGSGPPAGGGGNGDGDGDGSGDGNGNGEPPPTSTTTTQPPPPPPPPPPPTPELAFGLNVFPSFRGVHTAEDTARALADLAPGSIARFTLQWQSVQMGRRPDGAFCAVSDTPLNCTDPGPMLWGTLDDDLAVLHERGLQIIIAPLSAPPWARSILDLPVPNMFGQHVVPPADAGPELEAWQHFVMELVRHVQGRFPGLLAGIEVWNEPDGNVFWTTAQGPNPARYTNVLCFAYNGVKAVDPSVPVIFGGTYPGGHDLFMDAPQFLDLAYRNGAGSCMDSIGIHAYPTGASFDPVENFNRSLDSLRAVAASHGDGGRPLSITEVNLPSGNTDADMAAFLVNAYRSAIARGDVDLFIVHTLYDSARETAGICGRHPGQPSPVADALKAELGGTGPAAC